MKKEEIIKNLNKHQKILYLFFLPLIAFSLVYWKSEGMLLLSLFFYGLVLFFTFFNNLSKTLFNSALIYLGTFFILILLFIILLFIILNYSAGEIGLELLDTFYYIRKN